MDKQLHEDTIAVIEYQQDGVTQTVEISDPFWNDDDKLTPYPTRSETYEYLRSINLGHVRYVHFRITRRFAKIISSRMCTMIHYYLSLPEYKFDQLKASKLSQDLSSIVVRLYGNNDLIDIHFCP